jgi:uncharacterized protein (TIGR01777 family)
MQNRVLITGGSGLVGKHLSKLLSSNGFKVSHLGRNKSSLSETYTKYVWDPIRGEIDSDAIINTDYIIHLAGAGVEAQRWTEQYKKEIYDSRIISTRLLVESVIKYNPNGIKKLVSTSAIGVYGNHTAKNATENTPPGNTFLAKVCTDWEKEAIALRQYGVPVSIIRTGVVLAKEGGFIPKIAAPIKLFAGTALGTGNQYLSWVHIEDLCNMYLYLIRNENLNGEYNGVSLEPVTHNHVTRQMAERLHRPLIIPNAPVFVLKLLFGEMHTMLIASQHISGKKWVNEKFTFKYPDIASALANLLP